MPAATRDRGSHARRHHKRPSAGLAQPATAPGTSGRWPALPVTSSAALKVLHHALEPTLCAIDPSKRGGWQQALTARASIAPAAPWVKMA